MAWTRRCVLASGGRPSLARIDEMCFAWVPSVTTTSGGSARTAATRVVRSRFEGFPYSSRSARTWDFWVTLGSFG